jgi:adenine C2-methylase RlmN of 23S rRNA A2503 and tRNA A37
VDATIQDFGQQADAVLSHWDNLDPSLRAEHQWVHFNFMARGEALECRTILDQADALLGSLREKASARGLEARFLISTIFPKTRKDLDLTNTFRSIHPELYYSLYSVNPEFRRKWLPQALDPVEAVQKLAAWQSVTGKRPKVHFAFIRGENDSTDNVQDICRLLEANNLHVDLNVVRYNPPDERSQEAEEEVIERNVRLFRELMPRSTIAVIPRVGFDVQASCGMFTSANLL